MLSHAMKKKIKTIKIRDVQEDDRWTNNSGLYVVEVGIEEWDSVNAKYEIE